MARIPISVVIIAKNEEDNMDACILSAKGWADEIVVVDDNSTDATVAIAAKHGAVIYRRTMDNEGIHRNWAAAQAKNEWVLYLDADERVTPELQQEIDAVLPATTHVAFAIPFRTYIGHHFVNHSGWYPGSKTRFVRKSKFHYEEVAVHPRVFHDGSCGHLTKDIIHYGYPDIAHFLASLNRQTTLEAHKWVNTGRKMTMLIGFWRTIDRFFRSYIGKGGWKAGFMGFVIAYFASLYQIMSYIKYYEIINGIKEKSKP
ncbi:MAG: glycosyltransferase family 2 protein [Candidatus Omnitrophica bacterium]|nr:glycosyltransferase family 2 protein [Candidatus Omnitrophota bacterium]